MKGRRTGGKVAKYSLIEFTCETCGINFKSKSASKSYTPKFCSRACWAKRTITNETRQKQSEAKKGKSTWNKGISMWKDRQHPRGTLGMKLIKMPVTQQTKERLSLSHKGKKYPSHSKENHWNWRGGITDINEAIRKSAEYKQWRSSVFERDNFTCQHCGVKGGSLHADHIIPFSVDESKRFDVDNGRTLCADCHRKTETYGVRVFEYA